MLVFCVIMPNALLGRYYFKETYTMSLSSALKTEVACPNKTSVSSYKFIWHYHQDQHQLSLTECQEQK
jgi:hypothetical protein